MTPFSPIRPALRRSRPFSEWLERRYQSTIDAPEPRLGAHACSGAMDYERVSPRSVCPMPDRDRSPTLPIALAFQAVLLGSGDAATIAMQVPRSFVQHDSRQRFISHNAMGLFHGVSITSGAGRRSGRHRLMGQLPASASPIGASWKSGTTRTRAMYLATGLVIRMSQAWHHDLYRSDLRDGGRFWVMEQQPGPVNWADLQPDTGCRAWCVCGLVEAPSPMVPRS